MKKWWVLLGLSLILSGCGGPETFETMADVYEEPQQVQAQPVSLLLEEVVIEVGAAGVGDCLYLCQDYSVAVQTFVAGDLEGTLREVTGFEKDRLTLMEYRLGNVQCYECVWVSAGEGGDQIGKMRLLDDGDHHYVLSVMAPAEKAEQLADTWDKLFASFHLGEPETTKG